MRSCLIDFGEFFFPLGLPVRLDCRSEIARSHRALQARNDAGRQSAVKSERISDCRHFLPDY